MADEPCVSKLLAEFVGTFFLVFTIGCQALSTTGNVFGGVAIASSLMVMIYALGKSSGANFNPAVSLALLIAGAIQIKDFLGYIVVQFLGGLAAALAFSLLFWGKTFPNLEPAAPNTWWQALIAELVYTWLLCFVVLNVAASKAIGGKNQFYGLAIGWVIVAGAYGAGAISGGCFNPAVAWGLDFASIRTDGVKWCFIYTLIEFVAAIFAALFFWCVRPDEKVKKYKGDTPIWAKLIAEFLGTFILVFTVGLAVMAGSPLAVLAIASALMVMIFALGDVSGAHFNPAVTVACVASMRGVCSVGHGIIYIIVQMLAGLCAGLAFGITTTKYAVPATDPPTTTFPNSFALFNGNFTWGQVLAAEFFFTFVLAFVVLSVATVKSPLSEFFGMAIGFCVVVGGVAIGKISGGALNPAVAFGITSAHAAYGGGTLWHFIPYMAIEILAGLVAAGVFAATQPSECSGSKDKDTYSEMDSADEDDVSD